MGTHKGITYAAWERLEALMALEESRHEAKKAMREESGEDPLVAVSTGKIHSYRSREKYQGVVRRFIAWCKEEQQIFRLEIADARADELVTAWLTERLTEGLKPDTLQGDRAALRMFFQDWTLAENVQIPPRHWQEITRSRQPALRDALIPREVAEPLEAFFVACGVRRDEANHLRAQDIQESERSAYQLEIDVRPGYGKGGRPRRAPVYPGREQAVLDYVEGLPSEAHLFPHQVDSRLNPQAQRRQYAQDFYCLLSGRELPPTDRQLHPADYDEASAREVSRYLGHNRLDIILRSYLR
jgi:integrase